MRFALTPPRTTNPSEVSAYLRSLAQDRDTPPPRLSILESPRTILGALDAFRVARLIGAALPASLRPLLEAILEIEPAHLIADPRLRRIWALAFHLHGSSDHEAKRRELRAELDAGILLDQKGLDTVLAALLLERDGTLPQAGLLLDLAVMTCDPLAAASILAYAADGLAKHYPGRMDTWLEFFRSMTPRSLPYGWLSSGAEDYEVAGLLATIVLRHYGLAPVAPET